MATINEGYNFAEEYCPDRQYHGKPFRYCGKCGWMERVEEGPSLQNELEAAKNRNIALTKEVNELREGARMQIVAVPSYVMDLVRAVMTGEPLDFQGHNVPKAVQEELEKDWGPKLHRCFLHADVDRMAYRQQFLVGCQCHEPGVVHIWQIGDEPWSCPASGATIPAKMIADLMKSDGGDEDTSGRG